MNPQWTWDKGEKDSEAQAVCPLHEFRNQHRVSEAENEVGNQLLRVRRSFCSRNMPYHSFPVPNRKDNIRNLRTKTQSCVGGNINYLYDCSNVVDSDSSRNPDCIPPRIRELIDCWTQRYPRSRLDIKNKLRSLHTRGNCCRSPSL